jgi:transcriptional regulator with XRE-family HTH domain
MKKEIMSVGERIKNRRIELGISQTQLAKVAELTPAAISQFEAGSRKPSFDALSKLATALKVSTDYFHNSNQDTIAPEYIEMIHNIMGFSEENRKLMFEFYEFVKQKDSKNH